MTEECVRYIDEFANLRKTDYCCEMMQFYHEECIIYDTECFGNLVAEVAVMSGSVVSYHLMYFHYCPHCGAEIRTVDVKSADYDKIGDTEEAD